MDISNLPPKSSVPERQGGPLAWMARNSVAANLLMAALIFGGLVFISRVKQEVFPTVASDTVLVSIAYPGASPAEVERGISTVVEERVRGVDGVDEVTSESAEGRSQVRVSLELDANPDRVLSDVKAEIDRIASLPQDAEEPEVTIIEVNSQVMNLVIYGDAPEKTIRSLAEEARDGLLGQEGISQVELSSVRRPEISVEVPREKLRAYKITLDQVAAAIRAANVEVPAGALKTSTGEILMRLNSRRNVGGEFERIVVLARPDGTQVYLSDIATVVDGFAGDDIHAEYNGKPAAMIQVFRVGGETPISVSEAAKAYIEVHEAELPPGVEMAVFNDQSTVFRQRVDLLLRNATQGLLLVLLCLGLFLDIRLAFWVTIGIPISFLGALLFFPTWDVSVNMISLFAFLVTLGIVVDDAIVVGEAVFKRREEGLSMGQAAIKGLQDVAHPVVFSVLTTVVAFSPLLFVPGTMGKFFRNIPTVVITVLMLSLVESLLILPAHLSHENPIAVGVRRILVSVLGEGLGPLGWLAKQQKRFSARFQVFIEKVIDPVVRFVVRNRYLSVATATAVLIATFGYVASGRIAFSFMPKIESQNIIVDLEMPVGTPTEVSAKRIGQVYEGLEDALEEFGGFDENIRGVFTSAGENGSHLARLNLYLNDAEERKVNAGELVKAWRKRVAGMPGVRSLRFDYIAGAGNGPPIAVGVSHRDVEVTEAAARALADRLRDFAGVTDINDGVSEGKRQIDFTLRPNARTLGVDPNGLARQLRSSFFGVEASRQQRDRDELRVYVRLPEEQRSSLSDLEHIIVRTTEGGEIPIGEAATLSWGRAYTTISRENYQRVVAVEADVESSVTNENKVMAQLREDVFPELKEAYPGVEFVTSGAQKQQAESLAALGTGYQLALIVMFALMAIPFRSYVQPLIIMTAIPFGIVGAVGGHLLMGFGLSILSLMGIVALSGVVVNDSLVLITSVNEFRERGMTVFEAVIAGTTRRFRPILLTSLTTFFGLAPMIVETSVQARFLIPMALSLGFGVLFATFIILLVVPCLYVILDDVISALTRSTAAVVPEPPPSHAIANERTYSERTYSPDHR